MKILLFLVKVVIIEWTIELLRYALYSKWENPWYEFENLWEANVTSKANTRYHWWVINGLESLLVIILLYLNCSFFFIIPFVFSIIFVANYFICS